MRKCPWGDRGLWSDAVVVAALGLGIFATGSAGVAAAADFTAQQVGPVITSAPTTTFLADTAALFTVSATGVPAPTFSVTGSLPDGVDLANGQLVEEPGLGIGSAGTYHFTINATNPYGTASQAFTLIVRSPVAVGVEGTNGEMYVQAPQLPSGWQPMGGQITGPPAVAAAPNPDGTTPVQPFFIATGTNEHLYIR